MDSMKRGGDSYSTVRTLYIGWFLVFLKGFLCRSIPPDVGGWWMVGVVASWELRLGTEVNVWL